MLMLWIGFAVGLAVGIVGTYVCSVMVVRVPRDVRNKMRTVVPVQPARSAGSGA